MTDIPALDGTDLHRNMSFNELVSESKFEVREDMSKYLDLLPHPILRPIGLTWLVTAAERRMT